MPTSARSSRLTCSIRKRLAAPERTSPASAPSARVHIEDQHPRKMTSIGHLTSTALAARSRKSRSTSSSLHKRGAQSTNQSRSLRRAPAPFWLRPARPRRPSARASVAGLPLDLHDLDARKPAPTTISRGQPRPCDDQGRGLPRRSDDVRIWGLSKTQANYRPAPRREVRCARCESHVSPSRCGRVQAGPWTDPRHGNMRPLHPRAGLRDALFP